MPATLIKEIKIAFGDCTTPALIAKAGVAYDHLSIKLVGTLPADWQSEAYTYFYAFDLPDCKSKLTKPLQLDSSGQLVFFMPQELMQCGEVRVSVKIYAQTEDGLQPIKTSAPAKLQIMQGSCPTQQVDDYDVDLLDDYLRELGQQGSSLAHELAAEAEARTAADTILQSDITLTAQNITAEATTRAAADEALQLAIEAIQTNGSIAAEAEARTAADTTLQSDITLTAQNLTAEAATRAAADEALQLAIEANQTAVAKEVTDRTAADTTLQSDITLTAQNITAEAATRAAADEALQGDIDNLSFSKTLTDIVETYADMQNWNVPVDQWGNLNHRTVPVQGDVLKV
ncbi:MAG: hypothetical protein LBM65_07660, partial [Oscillospiraceae bacterium]|nr:hypothetical protein [Oscillospiraceae bacterium]